jgi:Rap1a immunity proteins
MPVLLVALVALPAYSDRARAVDSARELVNACRELESGREGAGNDILIPNSREALLCWGYLQAMQDLSVLVDQHGRRIIGSCPPEQTTSLQLVHSFLAYARSHAGELEGSAAAAVIKAFKDSFPCRQGSDRGSKRR